MTVASATGFSPTASGSGVSALGATLRLELTLQRREPLTWLYAMVFTALTAGFVGSEAVALVPRALRGDAPANAPMVLALALSGLAAFGQVITTMVTATAFLRDRATRTDALLRSTAAPWPAIVAGQWLAAIVILLVVTLGMPLGALAGALLRGQAIGDTLVVALAAWALVVLPATLLTASVHAVVAVHTRSLYGVLAAALVLLALWQGTTSEAVVTAVGGWVTALDPFGSAPLLLRAREAHGRLGELLPWSAPFVTQRLLLLPAAALIGAVAIWTAPRAVVASGVRRRERANDAAARGDAAVVSPARTARIGGTVLAQARLVARTTVRERGFVLITLLGSANAVVNVWAAVRGAGTGQGGTLLEALPIAREHGRLFLILLATIYAGELLWRDRDVRVDGLVDATPASTASLVVGRVAGLLGVEALVVALLASAALATARIAGATGPADIGALLSWGAAVGWLPFAQLTLVSLLVHVLIRQKVVAHLLLITAWIVAVALDQGGFDRPWYRIADVPALAWTPEGGGTRLLVANALHWTVVAGWALLVAVWRWPRGAPRRLTPPASWLGVGLALLPVLAVASGWLLAQLAGQMHTAAAP